MEASQRKGQIRFVGKLFSGFSLPFYLYAKLIFKTGSYESFFNFSNLQRFLRDDGFVEDMEFCIEVHTWIKVEYCALQMELIAKVLLTLLEPKGWIHSHQANQSIQRLVMVPLCLVLLLILVQRFYNSENWNHGWTSLQFTEAMFVLNKLLKLKTNECKNCKVKKS
ncbi:uncharacterized protein LOC131321068 [Rhododendron vialii]|uniref:uncharacterized protein LOC131321068 n=1 Tax=Rhododendron vialii TaxID=182163 RepID=UPI00265EF592|nr:uncharacterized protein LOC131321068 [Rhododendron vialii]